MHPIFLTTEDVCEIVSVLNDGSYGIYCQQDKERLSESVKMQPFCN